MTDLRQAAQQALEALEEINKLSVGENAICLPAEIDGAMDALRERLAQPKQEPVAYYHPRSGFYWAKPTSIFAPTIVDVPRLPLYTSPAPQPSMSVFLGLPEFIFNLVGEFSAAFLLFTGTLLFLPAQIADDSVLQEIRNAYKTELWIGLFLSASFFVSYLGKAIWSFVIGQISAQRTWVGLTYEEETELIRLAHNHAGIRFYIQAAEAKLKEKNT